MGPSQDAISAGPTSLANTASIPGIASANEDRPLPGRPLPASRTVLLRQPKPDASQTPPTLCRFARFCSGRPDHSHADLCNEVAELRRCLAEEQRKAKKAADELKEVTAELQVSSRHA